MALRSRNLRSLLLRGMLSLSVGIVVYYFAQRNLQMDNDLVASLTDSDPVKAALFEAYHTNSLFKGKIFINYKDVAPKAAASLDALAQSSGYQPVPLIQPDLGAITKAMLPMVPAAELQARLTPESITAIAHRALASTALPGGTGLLAQMERDPFGLQVLSAEYLRSKMMGTTAVSEGGEGATIHMYQSPQTQDFDHIGNLYAALVSTPGVHFIGADFFALENYRAIRSDINFCIGVSLPLSLLLFYAFTRTLWFPVILFFGSLLSFGTGVGLAEICGGKIYGIVLAFTSTFVSYNNESLVHLSALDPRRRRQNIMAISSALGTTLIGFVILLFADSVLVRQAAIVSIGGALGFLALVWVFYDVLQRMRFREMVWPTLRLQAPLLLGLTVAALLAAFALPFPEVSTHIETFRFQSQRLAKETEYFTKQAAEYQLDAAFAFPAPTSLTNTYARYVSALKGMGLVPNPHPLAAYRDLPDQRATLALLRDRYPGAVASLAKSLRKTGINLNLSTVPPAQEPIAPQLYLKLLSSSSPVAWYAAVAGHDYLFFGVADAAQHHVAEVFKADGVVVPMHPKVYYDELLTRGSQQMGWLFLVGIGLQAIYLLFIQRSVIRVVYILFPLVLTWVGLLFYFHWTNTPINIIHLMGMALIIGLAVDYTSIAVSVGHAALQLNKILLTGLGTLASFGVLIFASHPVLRDLGGVVTFGTILSLIFALTVRLDHGK